jgi:hypothetical protein
MSKYEDKKNFNFKANWIWTKTVDWEKSEGFILTSGYFINHEIQHYWKVCGAGLRLLEAPI